MFNKLVINSILSPIVKFRFASVGLILCLAFLSLGVTIGTAQVKYGESVHLQNQYPGEGGYLDTRGRVKDKAEFAEVGKYETSFVSTHPKSDRDKGSGSWMVESASGKSNGSPLLVGDSIYLKNMYPGGGYLDTWGYVRSFPVYKDFPGVLGVFTTPSNKREGGVSGTWIVRSAANKADGTPVNPGDNIHLENAYPNGGFLDTAGRVTQNPAFKEYEGSSLLVFTSASKNRDNGSGIWKITNAGSSNTANSNTANSNSSNPASGNEDNDDNDDSESNSLFLIGYTGPTTKRELIITLPFAKAQKLTVEIANDGTVIFQGDMILGNISDFAGSNPRSSDVNSWILPNSTIPYLIKAGYGKRNLSSADTKFGNFTRSDPPPDDANSRIWSNSTIPYFIKPGHRKRDDILAAINEINSTTNLCLVPRTNETDYVEFVSKDGKGFFSNVGKVGGQQEIAIDQTVSGKIDISLVAHEILHAAGFSHMQSREDRDRYVTINFRNIKSGMEHNFERLTDKATNIGPYDYTSIMHYFATAFSANKRNTIDIKEGGDISKMGTRRDDLAPGDIAAVATIYDPGPCKPAGKKPTATKPTATPQPTPQPTQPNKTPPTTTGNGNEGNIAIGKIVRQSGSNGLEYQDAKKAIDGNTDGRFEMGSVTQTVEGKLLYWEIDLGALYNVSRIVIWNRTDEGFRNSQQNYEVSTSDRAEGDITRLGPEGYNKSVSVHLSANERDYEDIGNIGPFRPWAANKPNYTVAINRKTRWIRISVSAESGKTLPGLSLAEVQVFGTPVPVPSTIRRR